METYTLRVTMTPDEDGWFVHCPQLEGWGAAMWGSNKEEALRFIEEVLEMVVEELIDEKRTIPVAAIGDKAVPPEYLVTVSI